MGYSRISLNISSESSSRSNRQNRSPLGNLVSVRNYNSLVADHGFTLTLFLLSPGFGLAVVARIVEQLGGQLRVDSKVNEGSRFSFLIPLALSMEEDTRSALTSSSRSYQSLHGSIPKHTQRPSQSSEIESLVEALTSNYMSNVSGNSSPQDGNKSVEDVTTPRRGSAPGALEAPGYQQHVRPVKVDNHDLDIAMMKQLSPSKSVWKPQAAHSRVDNDTDPTKLRVLVVEVRATDVL